VRCVNALDWIGQIADWLGRFFPRWVIVETTHGAVKWVKGSRVVALGPGVHWFWPITTEFLSYPIVRQTVDLRAQTLCTTDDKSIVVGGMIVYEIYDIEAIVARTFEPDDTIKDISLSAIHDVCCQKSWDELKEAQRTGALNRELKKEAARELDKFGVKVLKTTLTDMALCRVIKLMTSVAKDG
jgi:regulator of protease activity HflC (stomatin/prohibitin superfamily)